MAKDKATAKYNKCSDWLQAIYQLNMAFNKPYSDVHCNMIIDIQASMLMS